MLDNLKSRYENDRYEGYCVHAYPGLHDKLEAILLKHAPLPGDVLDLGCGSGAWGKRLCDRGYLVEGVDIEAHGERPFPFRVVDLNTDFSSQFEKKYSVVTAIELAEHIENPRHLLRQIKKLLKPGGTVLLSTPNASSLYSRARFFLTGTMASFTDLSYKTIGHITPITAWQMEKMIEESGFEVLEFQFADSKFLPPTSVADFVKAFCWVALRPFMMGKVGGQSMIVVLRNGLEAQLQKTESRGKVALAFTGNCRA
jgi:2-polyprenyl-3-methyl-5-hydroxy-6-metoxy-1,4-benzoquinol methylase